MHSTCYIVFKNLKFVFQKSQLFVESKWSPFQCFFSLKHNILTLRNDVLFPFNIFFMEIDALGESKDVCVLVHNTAEHSSKTNNLQKLNYYNIKIIQRRIIIMNLHADR